MPMFSSAKTIQLIPVKNMQRAVQFYTKKLGATVVMRAPGAMKNYWAAMRFGKTDIWFVAPEKAEKRQLAYTTFEVKNLRAAVKGLQKKGVKFDRGEKSPSSTSVEGPITWEPFGGAAMFHDTEGNLLMMWQNIGSM
jgi:predicted enzyme related to lactoylglutathione lyase